MGPGRKGRADSLSPAQLARRLETSEAAPVYLIAGSEAVLRDRALAAIRDKVISGEFGAFNYRNLVPSGLDVAALTEEMQVLPLGGGRRLVVIGPAEALGKECVRLLGAYAADPSQDTCLVLVAAEVRESLRKAFQGAVVVDCTPPYEEKLPGHLAEAARESGVRLDAEAAAVLAAVCGRDLSRAVGEVRKAADHLGPGGTITEELISDLIGGGTAGDIYRVASALARGDAPGAVAAGRRYLEAAERAEPRVLYEMGMHLRRLLVARGSLASGRPAREAARDAGVFWKDAEAFAAELRAWDEPRVIEAFRCLLEADRRVKGILGGGEAAIEAYVWAAWTPRGPSGGASTRRGRQRGGA
jgi:DNA polymerase-3 subunit delta